jgi:2-dehydropantoate 2-reductase
MNHLEPFYVVGAGGIGCAVGHALVSAGANVIFVDVDAKKIGWARQYGVGVDAGPFYRAEFRNFEEWQPAAKSTVLLCTKCYDNPAVLRRLPPGVLLIPIQNGFDTTLDRLGDFLEGIASFVSECYPHRTHTLITRRGRLYFGVHRSNGTTAALENADQTLATLAGLLSASGRFHTQVVADILPYKRTKLMYNAAIGPLAAAAGLDNGQLLAVPRVRRLFFQLLRENYAILRRAGLRLATIGPFHPDIVDRILRHPSLANTLGWLFYPTLRGTYCSMNADLAGGTTEIDFYNRYLIELAGTHPCPLNRRVYDLVKRMERERIAPHREILDELLHEFTDRRGVRAPASRTPSHGPPRGDVASLGRSRPL